jgi:hypothetical protein
MSTSLSTRPGGGIGRRKGLKIPRGQPRAGSTPALGMNMKNIVIILVGAFLLTSCAKSLMPIPGSIVPERSNNVQINADYGQFPENYRKTLKDYLQQNLSSHEDARVEFINKPSKISIDHLGDNYLGYRVCLSINNKNKKGLYTGFKNHLLLIKDSKIVLHLYDSGLLKIPFELCVERNESNTIFLKDVPDTTDDITIDQMDDPSLKLYKNMPQSNLTTYILCDVDSKEHTYTFNESNKIFTESIGVNSIEYKSLEFSETHIYASNGKDILINRVSGKIIISNQGLPDSTGDCKLLDRRKF